MISFNVSRILNYCSIVILKVSNNRLCLSMITYDGLGVLMMAEDDLRRVLGVLGGCSGLSANQTNLKIRPQTCCFTAHLTIMLPDLEIPLKSKYKK